MRKIRVLHPHIANQIAAGEVVERPASVVKELVENAIDADAKSITIEIQNGGIDYIRVTDNGVGIPASDALLAFERHATSKITSQEDLTHIETLGFRGEALASIASVAQVELHSRTKDDEMGMQVRVEGGEKKLTQPLSSPNGTTVTVSNLFFNVPARRKFLKSVRGEASYINDYISRMILVHPDISFRYINNQKTIYHSAGDSSLKNAVYCVYGDTVLPHLKEIAFDDGYLQIGGYIGTPEIARPNRMHQSFFLNGRYFHSPAISQALLQAYEGHLMGKRYPFAILLIKISSREVDVNVHPNKMAVRFAQEGRVNNAVLIAARKTLGAVCIPSATWPTSANLLPETPFSIEKTTQTDSDKQKTTTVVQETNKKDAPRFLPFQPLQSDDFLKPLTLKENTSTVPHYSITLPVKSWQEDTSSVGVPIISEEPEKVSINITVAEEPLVSEQLLQAEQTSFDASVITIIGQAFDTFWIVQQENMLYIIDQHAAHERRLYERMMAGEEAGATQTMLLPLAVVLTAAEMDLLMQHSDTLSMLGFRYAVSGENTLYVTEIPAIFTKENAEYMLRDAVELLQQYGKATTKDLRKEAIIQAACKHAIKAGDAITKIEIAELLQYFTDTGVSPTCPHGRPVMISLNKRELEKLFKRIV